MASPIRETAYLKPPKKRLFEDREHKQSQGVPPNFKRPRVAAVRDWPRFCGPLAPKLTGISIGFMAGNLQASTGNAIQSSKLQSTADAKVTKDKFSGSYPPKRVLKDYPVVRDFPAGFKSASSSRNDISSSVKFCAEPRPLETKYPKSLGWEVPGGGAYDGHLERSSYEESRGVGSKNVGEVCEESKVVVDLVDDAKEVCSLLGQEIQVEDASQRTLEKSTCKEIQNKMGKDFGLVTGKTYEVEAQLGSDTKKISVSRGQGKQGGGTCKHPLKKCLPKATISEYMDNFGDVGETYNLVARQDGVTKEIGVHPRVGRNLLQLDSWCQTVGNTVDRGKSVLRTAGKEGEIFSKGQTSMDHQTFVGNRKVQEALNLFYELLDKLTHKARLTKKKGILRKLPAEAAMDLKRQQKWVNTAKRIGHVPGVKIGDTFRYRVELSIIGLHRHFQNGIDYMMKDGKILAVSVVDSGRYANNKESSDVLMYSGQGGNPKVGKKQAEDQKLERGNLALKNSMDAGTPVRVTRGFQATKINSPGYTYEGLYFVVSYEQERNENETLIFKFQLRRITRQPKCDMSESKNSILCRETRLNNISHGRELKRSKKSKLQRRTILNDISRGKEEKPIPVVNTIDDKEPQPFTYIARMVYSDSYICSISNGCDCTNGCSDSVKCACVLKNGGEIPFNCNGAVIEAKPWIYECGPLCKCPPSCANRVSQNGIRFQLEVFKTKSTGWGVWSRNYIPSGSFICEYVGELIQHKEAEKRADSAECLFDLGGGMNYLKPRPSSSKAMDELPSCSSEANDGAFAIDATKFANVGRFINHSCSPNLYAQNVLYDNEDKRMPHIMLFAIKDIPPMRELTYDYNYMVGQVRDVAGKIKKKRCYCGSQAGCTEEFCPGTAQL